MTPTFLILIFSPPWADVPGVGTSLEILAYYGLFFFVGVIFNVDTKVLDAFASQFRFLAIPLFACLFLFLIPLIDRITLTSSPELLLQDWSLYQGETGTASLIGTHPFLQNPFNFSTARADTDWFIMCFLRAFCTWSAISGFIFLFRTLFNRPTAIGRYAADSSYFIYLIHFPIQLSIGHYLRDQIDSAFTCFLICLLLSLAICILMYHFLCRGTWVGVMLSGRRYQLGITEELAELRQWISRTNSKIVLIALGIGCAAVTIIEYRPEKKLLKMAHHAKVEQVQNYIDSHPDSDLSQLTRSDGRNPLHMAAHGMRVPCPTAKVVATLEQLIKAEIPVNSLDDFGQTPLHYSVRTGNLDALKTLLNAGADPNIPDKIRGNTVMHLAATLGAEEMLTKFLDAGGKPDVAR
ncbi:MAG: ankyrin repeat domain-containing protein, partial [Rubripirellula sp.]